MTLEQLIARHQRNAETINVLNSGKNLKKFLGNILPNEMLEDLFENGSVFKYNVYMITMVK